MITPPDPSGCQEVDGTLLTTLGNEQQGKPVYVTATLKCGEKYFILLQRKMAVNERDTTWKVVDQVTVSKLKRGYQIFPPVICESNNFPGNPTTAVGKFVKQPDNSFESRNITDAWRFDLDNGRIEPIPVSGILCSVDAVD
ncbi:hypothetical protein J2X76_003942 [Neorhizobium sp. 2083]|uniref:hypothetical protein n=1 Tax=Neorhizobium sp. 2083 TaxID=2817762 RepID=UPI0028609CBD|nr:hypothetical protein [Neorhizobium sp. 2083]MDR6818760.1 hypothetical protein [Neorhizobium sp. 2083]